MIKKFNMRQFWLVRLLSSFTSIYIFMAAIVAWLIIPGQIAHKQNKGSTLVVTERIVDNKLLAKPYTEQFVNSAVPLRSYNKKFHVYVSPNTANYFATKKLNYSDLLIEPWNLFFKNNNIIPNNISQLPSLRDSHNSVLILPSAVALSLEEKKNLLAFQKGGGSILATGATGSRDHTGTFQGYDFLHQLFGVTINKELGKEDQEQYINLTGDTPITAGYPAGQRVWLDKHSEKWLSIQGGKQAGLYSDWMRNSLPGLNMAGMAYGEPSNENSGRWIFLGFSETSWAWGSQTATFHNLLANSLHWLARGSLVTKATWPVPYLASYVVEMDTEEGYSNASLLAEMMDDVELPATFYSVTSEALLVPDIVREIGKRHEIAFHGDVHNIFQWQSSTDQAKRFDKMQQDMVQILQRPLLRPGFRAPREEYDQNTERILAEKKFGHHVVNPSRTDARLPFIQQNNGSDDTSKLVILPRTQHDDFTLPITRDSEHSEKLLLDGLIGDFEMIKDTGGMGILSVHSQHFGHKSLLAAVMPQFLQHAKRHQNHVWITTGGRIAEWWINREKISYSYSGFSEKYTITVKIEGKQKLQKGALLIMNARAGVPDFIQPTSITSPPGTVKVKAVDEFRTAIILDGMDPGTYSFEVTSSLMGR